jgi:hypothetical protein
MATIRGPRIVTSGLVLALDAADRKSYSGSGSSWDDLSGNSRTATLFNAPTYSSTNGGNLNFDDTIFEYGTVPNIGSLTSFSVEAWARTNKSLTGKATAIVANQYDGANLNFSLGTNNAPSSYNITFGFYNGAWRNTTGFSMTLDTWYHLVGTYNGSTIILYANGVLSTQTNYAGTATSGGEIRIARRWDEVDNLASNFFSGDVPVVRIYNRALSATEVTQNFKVNRGRFGL